MKQEKSGTVLLVGRPNSGKSTLLNNILQHKVAITSPKPQTTRLPIRAVYEDTRGQIVFVDTPGIFGKTRDTLASRINQQAERALAGDIDVVVYLIDHTRKRDFEENKTLGMVRKINAPKILAFNKIDRKKPDYTVQYLFMRDEFDDVLEISALTRANLNRLLDTIFEHLPVKEKTIATDKLVTPVLNMTSKQFLAEIVREKVFLFTHKEVPYSIATAIDEVATRDDGTLYVRGTIITDNDKYKGMLVGRAGRKIKEIGTAVRKELETATGNKVFVQLQVEVNPRWPQQF